MAKSLSSMSPAVRTKAVESRLRAATGGLGFLSAVAAARKMGEAMAAQAETAMIRVRDKKAQQDEYKTGKRASLAGRR